MKRERGEGFVKYKIEVKNRGEMKNCKDAKKLQAQKKRKRK